MIDLTKIRSNLKKLYRHTNNIKNIRNKPRPISLVIDLTGKCNWNCDFCYIKNRDKTAELDFKKLIKFIDIIEPRSVELTGGEPCLYSQIDRLILYLYTQRIKIGMFTNGSQLWRCKLTGLLDWMRVSINKYIDEEKEFVDPSNLKKLGYSYIVHEDSPKYWKERINKFMESHIGDYVKISTDINHQTNISLWGFYTPKAVIQKPIETCHYKGKCYMGYLKPYLNADGNVYSCVGTVKDYKRDVSKKIADIDHPYKLLVYNDIIMDCEKCRFCDRNEFVDYISAKRIEDEEFL